MNKCMSLMTTLNIVSLIENNPITRLSNSYQSKLITKIKNNFSNDDQQLFVASFYAFLNCNPNTEFVIDLENIWQWLDFSHKDKAKRLLENIFTLDKDYKCLLTTKGEQKKGRGGHNKETIMLTVDAFKRFCLKAGTKKADQIHNYYIKLEEMLHELINEESNELRLQLEQIKTTTKKEKELEKQKFLLREFGNAGALIYIVRVKSYENGEYVIKIGESRRGAEGRYNEHKSHYEEAVLLDCFLVNRSRDFEMFLHNHKDLIHSQVKDLPGHENEKELFLIGKQLSYAMLTNIIKNNINHYKQLDYSAIGSDIEAIKKILSGTYQEQFTQENNLILKNLIETQNILLQKVTNLERSNQEILEKLNSNQTKTTTGFEQPKPTMGPRLQKINPDTLQLIKYYETVTECMREDPKFKRPSIEKAVQENTIYNGFRWAYADRDLDPNVITNLQPTKITKTQNLGYIAKLTQDKTQIIDVYLDRKTAALSNGYDSSSALDVPVKNNTLTRGFYYMLYDKCDENLQSDFENRNNGEPILYKEGVGQFNEQNQLTREFVCKYDCIKSLRISDKTLAKALDKNVAYNGFFYKSIGSKLKCF